MGFLLGFLLGLIGALAGLGFLAYWLCSRSNNLAAAKFVNGVAQALASINRAKFPESLAAAKDDATVEEASETRKGKARER